MSKKLFSLAPLLAIFAMFAVMPAASQAATPHWFKGGKRLAEGPANKTPVMTWGGAVDLSQESPAGAIECKSVGAGYIENPKGTSPEVGEKGPAGSGATLDSSFYECKDPKKVCETKPTKLLGAGYAGQSFAIAYNFPWNNVLQGSGPFEEKLGTKGNDGAGQSWGLNYVVQKEVESKTGTMTPNSKVITGLGATGALKVNDGVISKGPRFIIAPFPLDTITKIGPNPGEIEVLEAPEENPSTGFTGPTAEELAFTENSVKTSEAYAEGFPAKYQAPGGFGAEWGAKGAIGAVVGCEIVPNPEGAVAFGHQAGFPERVGSKGEIPFEGELHPLIGESLNNTPSAANPAVTEFTGPSSGALEDPLGPGFGGSNKGQIKYLGYETQSPISVSP